MHLRMILLVLVSLLLTTSTSWGSNKNQFILNQGESEISIIDFETYLVQGGVYVYIKNEEQRKKAASIKVKTIHFKSNDSIYRGKVLNLFFSRERNVKPFYLEVDNSSKKIWFNKIHGKKMFSIGAKMDVENFIKNEKFNLTKLTIQGGLIPDRINDNYISDECDQMVRNDDEITPQNAKKYGVWSTEGLVEIESFEGATHGKASANIGGQHIVTFFMHGKNGDPYVFVKTGRVFKPEISRLSEVIKQLRVDGGLNVSMKDVRYFKHEKQ